MVFVSRIAAATALFLSLILGASALAQSPSIDAETIVERHIEARGGKAALRNLHSLIYSEGQYSEGDFRSDGQSVMMLMRPYFKLIGHPERDPGYMEGYDGAAWEWFADPGLVVRTVGPASEAIRHRADVEGPFLDFRDKGHRLELIGPASIGDRSTYQLRLTMPDGDMGDFFFDAETYLIIAERHAAPEHAFGEPIRSETRFSDFRRVAGVLFSFRSETVEIATGRTMSSMQWGRIEANSDIPVEWFSPPEFERTQIQDFMEHLFLQRTDAEAMLWTYRVFRRAYPDEDTRTAAEVIGFQALKMGDIEPAIALLERNAADNPNSASSAFGLGRAYATAGRREEARSEFERALQIEPGYRRAAQALANLE